MDKQLNHDSNHDESKTRTQRFSKLPDDGDPWAPNNLLKFGAKEKHQLNSGTPSNRQEAPVQIVLSGPKSLTLDAPAAKEGSVVINHDWVKN